MSPQLLEPELASQVEQVFVGGMPVLAFPRDRRARLAAAAPRASAVVEVSRAVFTLRHVPADVELVLLDDGAFAPAATLARTLPNAVLYRPVRPLPTAALRELGARVAQGDVVVLAHEHPGSALAAALAPEMRRVPVLAIGCEVVADPELLAAWTAAVRDEDEITLVVAVTPAELDDLAAAAESAGLGSEGTADLLAVPVDPGELPRVARRCSALYSRRALPLGLPVLGPEPADFDRLRAWARRERS